MAGSFYEEGILLYGGEATEDRDDRDEAAASWPLLCIAARLPIMYCYVSSKLFRHLL